MNRVSPPFKAGLVGDQADGLRRRFRHAPLIHVPLVANPHAQGTAAVLERIATVFTQAGHTTLLVDAAGHSPAPGELAQVDLGACIEVLDERTRYLPARGLIRAFVDSRGSAVRLLDALADAAPQARIVLVHGDASDLARVFAGLEVQPLLLGAESPQALQHAYAGGKILCKRAGLMNFDLVLAARPGSARTAAVADALGRCLDRFLGALLRHWVAVDPAAHVTEPPPQSLAELLAWQLRQPGALPVAWREASRRTVADHGVRP